MMEVRNDVHHQLTDPNNRTKRLPRIDVYDHANYYEGSQSDVYFSDDFCAKFYQVGEFYYRLETLRKHNLIAAELIPEFFGDEFVYWNIVHFRRPEIGFDRTGWPSAQAVNSLNTWLESTCPDLYRMWYEVAAAHKQQIFEPVDQKPRRRSLRR